MDEIKAEIEALAGENIATQALLTGLMLGLKSLNGGEKAVSDAFFFADMSLENLAMSGQGTPGHTTHALQVLDQLRSACQSG